MFAACVRVRNVSEMCRGAINKVFPDQKKHPRDDKAAKTCTRGAARVLVMYGKHHHHRHSQGF